MNDPRPTPPTLSGNATTAMTSYIGKYDVDDQVFMDYRRQMHEYCDSTQEAIDNFPLYTGAVNLARFFALYEIYRRVIDHAGHIADIGSYKGASLLFFAKLIKLFEPYSPTEVHGFEWFRGQQPGPEDDQPQRGKYIANKKRLQELIELQGYSPHCKLYDIDLSEKLGDFFEAKPHLRYKLVFIDCGIANVMRAVFSHFWDRIPHGGIIVLDHYNDPVSPSESGITDWANAMGSPMLQIPYTRSPTTYFVKK